MFEEQNLGIVELFEAATDLEGDAREQFLEEVHARDAALHQELVQLLAADENETQDLFARRARAENETVPGQKGAEPAGQASTLPASTLHDDRARASSQDAPGQRLPKGLQIKQYEVIRLLGEGGMGEVYLARDTKLGRRVAMKFLNSDERQMTERFIIEARATARCSHENIVVIHEVDEHDGKPFMVLEYLKGRPLSKVMRSEPMPVGRAVELMLPVVRALQCAHDLGIVHRDLKPDNIFVTDSGVVKVLDFGIAKVLSQKQAHVMSQIHDTQMHGIKPSDANLSMVGMLMGTMPYMSPEQWNGRVDQIDARTDLWAVGIMLFEMVTGRHPLAPLVGPQLLVTGLVHQAMPSVRSAGFTGADELADVIDRCLEKSQDKRIGSTRELIDALEPLLSGRQGRELESGESPYPGLTAFQESDADRFFGRSHDIASMMTRLDRHSLMGVVGPSGVGKSSFVRAGVVPALKRTGEHWEALIVRPGRDPFAALAGTLMPLITSKPTSPDHSAHRALANRFLSEPGYVGVVLRKRARARAGKVMLFVDQFEELYTLVHSARERAAFCDCLAAVADDPSSPLRVIISIRSDFLDRVAENRPFAAELTPGLVFLPPPDRDGLREALVQPASMLGYGFETDEMVDDMLDKLDDTPGALPLLQFAVTKLWEVRDRSRKLMTGDSYRELGGVGGALASHADAVLNALPPREQEIVRMLFERLVTPERTRAVVPVRELRELSDDPDDVERLMEHLVNARLLVVQADEDDREEGDDDGDGPSVELIHEAMIQSWPRLAHWIDEHHEDAVFLQQLRVVAKQWQDKGYPRGLLWRGESVEEARRWYRHYRGPLTRLQKQYLDAVMALDERAARRKKQLVAGLIVFLLVLVAAAAVALIRITRAERDAKEKAAIVQQQLDEIRQREQERDAAKAMAASATDAAKMSREQLIDALADAQAAKERAEEQSHAATVARDEAHQKEIEARTAYGAARRAKEEAEQAKARLTKLLDEEKQRTREQQKRIKALESKRGRAAGGELD